MACIWSTSVQLTWGVAALRAIVTNMHIWASRVLKPQLQAWVVQTLQAEVESPTVSTTTPDDDPTLSNLFASPQVNVTSTSKPPPSAAATSGLRDVDRSPCRLGSNAKVVGSRPVTPSSPAHPTIFVTTPSAKLTTTSSTSTGATPTATATSLITSGLFGTPLGTDATPQTKNNTIMRDNGSATKAGASVEAELDQITKSLDSTTIGERAGPFGFGSQFATTKGPTIWETLSLKSKTPAQSSGATFTHSGTNVLAQKAACATKTSLFNQTSPGYLFGSLLKPFPASGSNIFKSQPTPSSTSSAGLFGGSQFTPVSLPFSGFGNTELSVGPTNGTLSGGTNPAVVSSSGISGGASVLGYPRLDVEVSSRGGLFGSTQSTSTPGAQSFIFGNNASKHDGIFNYVIPVTTSQFGSRLFSGTEDSEKEDVGANASIFNGFKIWQQSEQQLHHTPPIGNHLECAASGEHQSRNTIDSKSGSETAHDTKDDNANSAAHLFDEDENRTSEYRDDTDENALVSGSDEFSDIASEPFVDESDSEPQSDDVAPNPRPRPKYLSESDYGWLIGMGSLSGYELARAPYLRTLFMARSPSRQISMLRVVLGSGSMQEDRYWLDHKDRLGKALTYLNRGLSNGVVTKKAFREGRATKRIATALDMMFDNQLEKTRWRCFRDTLSMRSAQACSETILLDKSFNLTEEEWAAWEDSALQATDLSTI